MLTPEDYKAVARHLAAITAYDAHAGQLCFQVWRQAEARGDIAARVWIAQMAHAVRAIQSPVGQTRIDAIARRVLDGSMKLW
jgi:hypothetical protein